MKRQNEYLKKSPDEGNIDLAKVLYCINKNDPNQFNKIISEIRSYTTYVERTSVYDNISKLIVIAEKFSEKYSVDIEILENGYGLMIKLFLFYQIFSGNLKKDLSELIFLADDFIINPYSNQRSDYTVVLYIPKFDMVKNV